MAADIPNNYVEFRVASFDEFQVQSKMGLENIFQKTFDESTSICWPIKTRSLTLFSIIRIALIVVFLAYCMFCAWCFTWVEIGTWYIEYGEYLTTLDRHRNETTHSICEKLKIVDCDANVFNKAYEDYENLIMNNLYYAKFKQLPISWTFRNSFGFVLAIFFTTGDTPLAPRTQLGRILSCIFPILGIPLFLTVSLFYGRLLNQMLSWLYLKMITKENVDHSTETSNHTISIVLHPKTVESSHKTKNFHHSEMKREKESSYMHSRQHNNPIRSKTVVSDMKDQPSRSSEVQTKSVELQKSDVTADVSKEKPKRILNQESCALPIKIAVIIFYAYIALGSVILHLQVDWEYISAFYYLQLTFTTTGIGDLDPGDVGTLFHSVYVFLGFILAAVVLESIRAYLTENFRYGLE